MRHPALLFRLLLEHVPMAVVALDARDEVLWTNPGFLALLGADSNLVGRRLTDILRMVTWLPVQPEGEHHSPGLCWQRVWLASEGREASRVVLMAEMLPEDAPADVARLLAFVDLQDGQVEAVPPLSDPHTGLASQWVFEDRLRHATARADRHAQPLAVLMMRLDRADEIRRSCGESAMATLTAQIGRRLAGTLRDEDSIVYLGGDRWAALVEHPASAESLQAAALRCLEAMEAPFTLSRPPMLLTLSVGIALYPDDGVTSEQLMARAAQALEAARPAGYAFYDRGLKQRLSRRMALRRRLQEALLSPDRHFVVVYQPQVDLASGRCVGVEALVRWRHPERGMLPPDDFLPMVAEMAQMVRLDRFVIERVIAQHHDWQATGGPLSELVIAVNLDASLLEQNVFDGRPLDRFLRECGGDLDWLSLEIDARSLSSQAEAHGLLLRRLSRMGVGLVVDNLGESPVDLTRLAMLPVSQGKIGRELVHGLTDSRPFARQAVSALAQCLKALQLGSIMVGVESTEELAAARRKGVGRVQGNLLGPPMAADALATWLAERPDRWVLRES
ncbi:Phytochrome-like protein cph2 [Halomonas sp. THAF5a]|uniref:EAL domain-containing protein n=1 Tax=Halomonas sp. THAF5a TaxID=2587844 RepID=UPI0012688862|nr:EAL domain-containing protein [Halomonas sp. THAF5a]QFU00107.1 Phytochrome-like protein cph2 [Halomonas sp. THAF5a]